MGQLTGLFRTGDCFGSHAVLVHLSKSDRSLTSASYICRPPLSERFRDGRCTETDVSSSSRVGVVANVGWGKVLIPIHGPDMISEHQLIDNDFLRVR